MWKFGEKTYVPVLKAKAGELNALETAQYKGERFIPLIEAVSANKSPAQNVALIRKAWPIERELFLDAVYVETPSALGEDAIALLANEADAVGLRIVPVTGLNRSASQKAATAVAAGIHNAGVCVRLVAEDIDEPEDIDNACNALMSTLGLSVETVHAVIDLASINGQATLLRRLIADAIRQSSFLQHAATLTVAATAFPKTMDVTPNVITAIPRHEWSLWNAIRGSAHPLPRNPSFGDYAVTHPELGEFDPEVMTPSAKIAYTVDLAWLALKGRSVKGPAGYGQYHQLATQMTARHEFRGPAFSPGDYYLRSCATNNDGPGNLMTWVTVKTSHHLAHVVDQIANLP